MIDTLETERLLLRNYIAEDAEACFEFLSDKETCYMDGGYEPFDEMDEEYGLLMEKFSNQKTRYMIVLKSENKVIGTIHLQYDKHRAVKTIEVGYVISPNYRRRGYMSECLKGITAFLFQNTDTELITASAISRNIPSLTLLRKLGFTKEGNIHKGFSVPDEGAVDLESFYLERVKSVC